MFINYIDNVEKYYAPRKTIVGLNSVMPLVWLIKTLPSKSVAMIYFSRRIPWKFINLKWSLTYHYKKNKILNGNKLRSKNIASRNGFDTVVIYGSLDDVSWFKNRYPYKELIVIEDMPGLMHNASCISFNKHEINIDAKNIPLCLYSNYRRRWKDDRVYKKHYVNVLSFCILCFGTIDDSYIKVMSSSVIKELLALAIEYKRWDNILGRRKKNTKVAVKLEQIDLMFYQVFNNVLLNNASRVISHKIKSSKDYSHIDNLFDKDLLNNWDKYLSQSFLKSLPVKWFEGIDLDQYREVVKKFYVF